MLESAYRIFFKDIQHENPGKYETLADLSDLVFSIMTGGDYALIHSVEFFEDYQEFGKEQTSFYANICFTLSFAFDKIS